MATLFSIGVSGLQAAQRSIAVTSQNISNSSVDGYARQRVELMTRDPVRLGNQFVGAGVNITGVTRQHDQFLDDQVVRYTASSNMSEVYSKMSSQLDELFADKNINVSGSLQKFYDSVQSVAANPSYIPSRQVMMSEGQSLVERFQVFDSQINELGNSLNQSLENYASELSSLSSSIAQLNRDISLSGGNGVAFSPNDLLSQRDSLVRKVSELANVQTAYLADGSVNLFVGQGQPLVLGPEAFKITTIPNEFNASNKEIAYVTSAGTFKITDQITGGAIGGSLAFRNEVLNPAQANIGRIAYGIADSVNQQHRMGMDLNGDYNRTFFDFANAGGKAVADSQNLGSAVLGVNITSSTGMSAVKGYELTFNAGVYTLRNLDDNSTQGVPGFPYSVPGGGFSLHLTSGAMAAGDKMFIQPQAPRGQVLSNTNNTGAASVNVTVTDINKTNGDEYQMTYNGVDFTLRNLTDNSMTTLPGTTTFPYDVPGKGFQIYISGAAAATDTWMIQPTRLGAQSLSVAVKEPAEIAAANPLRSTADIQNLSTATITAPAVKDIGNSALTNPIQIVFTGAATFDVIDVNTSTTVAAAQVYNSLGTTLRYNGWEVTLRGAAQTGDKFNVEYNANGVGDNANARMLADLQNTKNMDKGKSSLQETYSALTSEIGTKTRLANNFNASQVALLGRADAQREQVSGVNLDEEAADMMRFQQAYQASAQILVAADKMLQTLFNALGR